MNTVNANHPESSILLRQDEAGITTLTLNRPGQYNALSKALLTALQQALNAIGQDPTVRVDWLGR